MQKVTTLLEFLKFSGADPWVLQLSPTSSTNFADHFCRLKIMPTGRHLTAREKEQVYFGFVCQGQSVGDVYLNVFAANRQMISYRRLSEICSSLRYALDEKIDLFLSGVDKRKMFAGRKQQLSGHEVASMLDIIAANRNQTIKQVRDQYMELWFEDIQANMISESLVYQTFKRERLSHRILETRNMLQNPQQQMEFLNNIRHVDPARIIAWPNHVKISLHVMDGDQQAKNASACK